MAKHPVFSVSDVNHYYNNLGSARSAVKRLLAKGKALKIRNGLYTCVSAEHGGPIADRFQIASSTTATSYVSHHTAMEYYGITDQVFCEVYVSSETRFHDFEFEGYTYHFVKSRLAEGVNSPLFSGGIRVTDQERTLLDSLKDMDMITGAEELLANIPNLPHLREEKLLIYLNAYNNQFLYQKAGFLLWDYRNALGLSDHFFEICRSKIGQSKRYLTRDDQSGSINNEWNLIIPVGFMSQKNGEVLTHAAV